MADDPGRLLSRPEQRNAVEALRAGLALSDFDVTDLSMATVMLDRDTLCPAELARVLQGEAGAARLTAHEHDVLAQALNDHFLDLGAGNPVRYSAELGCD